MKHVIYILRHAKSKSGGSDYERKLNKKGVADANTLAAWMRQLPHRPDTIISSSAVRGRHTASIMAAALGLGEENASYVQSLYGATTSRWLLRLRRLNERKVQHVLLVGHNPELELLASKLAALPQLRLPPCGMVAIQSNYGWAKLGTVGTTLLCSHYPKRYMELRPEIISVTSQAVQAAVACLPAAARGGEAKHLLGESIHGAITEIMSRQKKNVAAAKSSTRAASRKKPLAKKTAAAKSSTRAASRKKPLAKKATAAKSSTRAASRKKPLAKKATAAKSSTRTASRKKPLAKKATAAKSSTRTASRKKPLAKKATAAKSSTRAASRKKPLAKKATAAKSSTRTASRKKPLAKKATAAKSSTRTASRKKPLAKKATAAKSSTRTASRKNTRRKASS